MFKRLLEKAEEHAKAIAVGGYVVAMLAFLGMFAVPILGALISSGVWGLPFPLSEFWFFCAFTFVIAGVISKVGMFLGSAQQASDNSKTEQTAFASDTEKINLAPAKVQVVTESQAPLKSRKQISPVAYEKFNKVTRIAALILVASAFFSIFAVGERGIPVVVPFICFLLLALTVGAAQLVPRFFVVGSSSPRTGAGSEPPTTQKTRKPETRKPWEPGKSEIPRSQEADLLVNPVTTPNYISGRQQ